MQDYLVSANSAKLPSKIDRDFCAAGTGRAWKHDIQSSGLANAATGLHEDLRTGDSSDQMALCVSNCVAVLVKTRN